jgi:type IV pilus assembly protein PilE
MTSLPFPRHRPRHTDSAGFTLIELMIVVGIVAILAAVAIPSYQESVRRGRRADARVAMTNLATRLERCFTQFGAYDADDCEIASPADSPEGFYEVTVETEAATWTLTAEPQGAQADDEACGTFTLTNTGQRDVSGTTPERCW